MPPLEPTKARPSSLGQRLRDRLIAATGRLTEQQVADLSLVLSALSDAVVAMQAVQSKLPQQADVAAAVDFGIYLRGWFLEVVSTKEMNPKRGTYVELFRELEHFWELVDAVRTVALTDRKLRTQIEEAQKNLPSRLSQLKEFTHELGAGAKVTAPEKKEHKPFGGKTDTLDTLLGHLGSGSSLSRGVKTAVFQTLLGPAAPLVSMVYGAVRGEKVRRLEEADKARRSSMTQALAHHYRQQFEGPPETEAEVTPLTTEAVPPKVTTPVVLEPPRPQAGPEEIPPVVTSVNPPKVTEAKPVAPPPTATVSEDALKRKAYELYEAAGRPQGRDQEFWAEAQRQLQPAPVVSPISTTPPTANQALDLAVATGLTAFYGKNAYESGWTKEVLALLKKIAGEEVAAAKKKSEAAADSKPSWTNQLGKVGSWLTGKLLGGEGAATLGGLVEGGKLGQAVSKLPAGVRAAGVAGGALASFGLNAKGVYDMATKQPQEMTGLATAGQELGVTGGNLAMAAAGRPDLAIAGTAMQVGRVIGTEWQLAGDLTRLGKAKLDERNLRKTSFYSQEAKRMALEGKSVEEIKAKVGADSGLTDTHLQTLVSRARQGLLTTEPGQDKTSPPATPTTVMPRVPEDSVPKVTAPVLPRVPEESTPKVTPPVIQRVPEEEIQVSSPARPAASETMQVGFDRVVAAVERNRPQISMPAGPSLAERFYDAKDSMLVHLNLGWLTGGNS